MSATHYEANEAAYLKYGFLAAKSSKFIERLLNGERLDADADETLQRARRFLSEVSSGAKLVNTGVHPGASSLTPLDTMTVLGYAIDPIEQLHLVMNEEDIAEAFSHMAGAIATAMVSSDGLDEADKRYLGLAKQFFDYLYHSLISSIDRDRKLTARRFELPSSLLAHA